MEDGEGRKQKVKEELKLNSFCNKQDMLWSIFFFVPQQVLFKGTKVCCFPDGVDEAVLLLVVFLGQPVIFQIFLRSLDIE